MLAQLKVQDASTRHHAVAAKTRPLVVGVPASTLRQLRLYVAICAGPSLEAVVVDALLAWLFWMESRPVQDVGVALQYELEWLTLELPEPVLQRCLRVMRRNALGHHEGTFESDAVPSLSFSGMVLCAVELFFESPSAMRAEIARTRERFPSSLDLAPVSADELDW